MKIIYLKIASASEKCLCDVEGDEKAIINGEWVKIWKRNLGAYFRITYQITCGLRHDCIQPNIR
jgi:hypothetical protein